MKRQNAVVTGVNEEQSEENLGIPIKLEETRGEPESGKAFHSEAVVTDQESLLGEV